MPIEIEPQVFDLLVYLIENRDRVVTRDDLLASVWGGRIVSESTLASRINAARKAVGDTGEAQQLIRTLPRKGLRFVGEMSESVPAIRADPQHHPAIAVLPFENLSADVDQDYFADGMVAEIITGLSRIKWLFVISRNSTFSYKGRAADVRQVGRELNVRYVLEGTVRRSGDRIRVSGQLVDVEKGAHVWADRYERTLSDIFALQDDITMQVVGAIEPTLRKAEVQRAMRRRPDNLDAYDLYLRALPLASAAMPRDAEKAIALLTQALALEPDYASVHGFLAWCHEQRYLRDGLDAGIREAARHHAHEALRTGADDAMATAMGAFVVGALERDYTTAIEGLDRALELSPSSALAFGFSSIVRAWRGDNETAIAHGTRGIQLSPLDPLIYLPCVGLAYAYFFSGDFSAAADAATRAANANPAFSVPRYLHAASLYRLDRKEEALTAGKALLQLQPNFTVSGLVAGGITTVDRIEPLARALLELGLPR